MLVCVLFFYVVMVRRMMTLDQFDQFYRFVESLLCVWVCSFCLVNLYFFSFWFFCKGGLLLSVLTVCCVLMITVFLWYWWKVGGGKSKN